MYWRMTAPSVVPRHVVAGLAQCAALFHPPLPSWLPLKAQLLVGVPQRDGGVDLAMVDRSLEFSEKAGGQQRSRPSTRGDREPIAARVPSGRR